MARHPDPLGIKPKARIRKRMEAGGLPPQEKPGRPSSAAKKRSLEVANAIAEGKRMLEEHDGSDLPADATPLDVMMMAMRKAYKLGGSIAATPYAEKCAPYIHARIAQMELKTSDDKPFTLAFKWSGD
jgi:hypothetical protein